MTKKKFNKTIWYRLIYNVNFMSYKENLFLCFSNEKKSVIFSTFHVNLKLTLRRNSYNIEGANRFG